MSNEDYRTTLAMAKYGGSFVFCLARLAALADDENLQIIKQSWPAYWSQYKELGQKPEFDNAHYNTNIASLWFHRL